MGQTTRGMDRRRFLQVASGSAAALVLSGEQVFGQSDPPQAQPNFLWISTEDISPDLGCYGDAYAVTPNLDRLAEQGVRYNNVFSHSGVCAPTRSGIITGMYPTTIGTHHMRCAGVPPEQVRCFPEYLRAAGYYCTNNSKTDYQFAAPLTAWDECSNTAHWRNRPDGKPFFAVINFTTTHESQIRNRNTAMLNRLAALGPEERHDPAQAKVPPYYSDTPKVREDWAQYYDLITLMDKQVAGVLEQLQDDGLAEDTIVWFWGDHGRGLPRAKRWIYDSGLRVPLIVHIPERWRRLAMPDDPDAVKPGTANDDLIAFIDFAPTMLSLAGIDIPRYMQGRAFLGRQKAKPREYIYAARDRMDEAYDLIRAVRDKRYKYIRNYMWYVTRGQDIDYMNQMPTMQEMRRLNAEGALEGAQKQYFEPTKPLEELYDIVADPHEVNNLAADPKHAEALERLRQAHAEWYNRTQDLGLIPEPIFDELKWPDGKQDTTTTPAFTRQQGGAVTVVCATPGVSIAYRVDGDPNSATGWLLYTRPVRLGPDEVLYAKACRIGYADSAVVTFRLGDPLVDRPSPVRSEHWKNRLDATNLRQRLWRLRQLDFEGPNANHLYVNHLDAEFAPTRYWAVEGLRANGRYAVDREYALEPLRARLEDPSVAVRIAAARTLCEWGSSEAALPVLTAALEHRTAKARLLAVIALSQIGRKAEPALTKIKKMATDDPDEYVRRVATAFVARTVALDANR